MIDRSEVTQMAKFMAAMQSGADALHGEAAPSEVRPAIGLDASAVAEMKAVLERFHAATDHMVSESHNDRELREALITEATPGGARIGLWEIRVNQTGRHNLYDVVDGSGQALAVDLLLYEVARGLVRILNEGGRLNSPEMIELLRAEQEYNSRVQDMVLYRHRMTCNPRSPRVSVFEARYSDARRRAALARMRIGQLCER